MITNINQLDLTKQYTYADYLTWQLEERLELIKGFIYKMSPAPARKHQYIEGNLYGIFWNYFRGKSCQVYPAPFDVRIPKKQKSKDKEIVTVLQPDICVICDLQKLDDRGCVGAPDLVIEILSPGNTQKEMKFKFEVYEESGVKEYWVVQPEYRAVLVYLLDEKGKFIGQNPYSIEDEISPAIFPELKISLTEVFGE